MIAIIAGNCAALRTCFFANLAERDISLLLLGGLLPLANIVFLSLYLISKRYRISLRRQPPERRAARIGLFTALAGLELLALVLASLPAPFQFYVMGYVDVVYAPIEPWFNSFTGERYWIADFVILPLFAGIVLSGLPLVLAYIVAWILSWFELVAVPRARPPGQIE